MWRLTIVLPSRSIVTGDIESKIDLKNYAAEAQQNDLCCGAAEFFESFLENLGFLPQQKSSSGLATE